MKINLLFTSMICLGVSTLFAQLKSGRSIPIDIEIRNIDRNIDLLNNAPKSMLCQDTIRYAYAKEAILGTPTFYAFELWSGDLEFISHTFLNSGSVDISGAEFQGRRSASSGSNPNVEVSIYSVDASNNPLTQLASAAVTINAIGIYQVIFPSTITVSGNYAIVVRPTTGVMDIVINNDVVSSYDENLAKYKSDYYASSNNNWIPVSGFSEYVTASGYPVDFEPIVAPFVSYTINTTANVTPLTACLGEEVVFTNTTTTPQISNRMYNYQVFREHFSIASIDSTFVWYLDNGGPLVWSGNTAHTYSTAGTYDTEIGTNGGFWESCFDFAPYTVTINPLPVITQGTLANPTTCSTATGSIQVNGTGTGNVSWTGTAAGSATGVTLPYTIPTLAAGSYDITFEDGNGCTSTVLTSSLSDPTPPAAPTITPGGATTFCAGGSVTLTSSQATGNVWSANTGSATTQQVTANTSGNYTVTYTDGNGCSATSAPINVVVNNNPAQPTITPGGPTTFCSGGSVTLTSSQASGNVWSANAGSATTQQVTATAAGSYTVTFTNGSGCSATSAATVVTVNPSPATPTISVTGATTFCAGGSVVLTSSQATGNVWSANAGSVTTQGVTVTTAGSYTVTYSDGSGCSATSAPVAVTVNSLPTVTQSALGTVCVYNPSMALTGGLPTGGTYSGTGVTAGNFDPATAGNGTHTITYTYQDGNNCVNTATANIVVDGCLSIGENDLTNVKVYPNPTELNLTIEVSGDFNYEILDTKGRIIEKGNGNNTVVVNTTDFTSGVYFVSLTSETLNTTIRVVKN